MIPKAAPSAKRALASWMIQLKHETIIRALSLVLMLLVFVCTGIMNRFGADEEGGVIA